MSPILCPIFPQKRKIHLFKLSPLRMITVFLNPIDVVQLTALSGSVQKCWDLYDNTVQASCTDNHTAGIGVSPAIAEINFLGEVKLVLKVQERSQKQKQKQNQTNKQKYRKTMIICLFDVRGVLHLRNFPLGQIIN